MPDDLHRRYAEAATIAHREWVNAPGGGGQSLGERIADAALAVRDEELETARAAVLEYENTITWFTTCKGCAATLDFSYAETVRAEKAEEALDSSRTALDRVAALARSLADTDPEMADLIAETVVGVPGEGEPGAALALLDPPEPR